ncbi:MAG: TetR/AcrR family transcriptional regulator, partial [Nocardioides sp.]|nr:TetR/AcrR family transcriptional regulator [Nocardioides sp.]
DAVIQTWVERVYEHADKALATEGDARARLMAWFEEYLGMLTAHKGAAALITCAFGDVESPIKNKCQVYAMANERVIDKLREEGALREGTNGLEVARLVGGVATIADQGALRIEDVRGMLDVIAYGLLKEGEVPAEASA